MNESEPGGASPQSTEDPGFDDTMSKLVAAGPSFRRMTHANEEFGADGVRTIWHRGRERTELLSWEDKAQQIIRQELTFLGMVVELKEPDTLKTGTVPLEHDTSQRGQGTGEGIQLDSSVSARTLDFASTFLRHVPDRDYYVQHLLKKLNACISSLGIDSARTAVTTRRFSRNKPSAAVSATEPNKTTSHRNKLLWGLLAAAAVILGLLWGMLR